MRKYFKIWERNRRVQRAVRRLKGEQELLDNLNATILLLTQQNVSAANQESHGNDTAEAAVGCPGREVEQNMNHVEKSRFK